MKNKIKKSLCILFALILTLTIITPTSYAASTSSRLTKGHCLIINTYTNKMGYYKDGKMVRQFNVATGKSSTPTPTGKSKIVNKIKNRPYFSGGIPGGDPRNPLGDRWLGLHLRGTYGTTYGIHGNNDESSIGKHISGGCIRMHNKEVRWLYDQVPRGTTVILARSTQSFPQIAKRYNVILEDKTNPTKPTTKYPKQSVFEVDRRIAPEGKYLTYINGKGYSRYSYISKSGKTGIAKTTWMKKAGIEVVNPSKSNGYKTKLSNPYIQKVEDAKKLLTKVEDGKISKSSLQKELNKMSKQSYKDAVKNPSKVKYSNSRYKSIYQYDAGKGKYLTTANGKNHTQYSYLNKNGKDAYITQSNMTKVGLKVQIPSKSNGYVMQINNPYIKEYNKLVDELNKVLKSM
ncbi:MAG: L,D-transpeptidase [Peptostreptococcaceae bacterium]